MSNIQLFQNSQIRSIWDEKELKWYFSVIDVVAVLTDSPDSKDYWYRMKKREKLSGVELSTICRQLKLESSDGKLYKTDCSDAQGLLRIIQSIPSAKAEPFKKWLALVGYQRMEEIENPELAQKRIRETYKAKGYSDEWIEKRIRGITVRDELTNEWKNRGVKEGLEYSILTAEISKATFGIIPSDYKKLKGLTKPSDNLRYHMNDLKLIFTMLGEASTTEIAKNKNARGFSENKKAARAGGSVAGKARLDLEKKSGKNVISKENFKEMPESQKRSLK